MTTLDLHKDLIIREKVKFYNHFLRFCYKDIINASDTNKTEIFFNVRDTEKKYILAKYSEIPYDYDECLEYISQDLRKKGLDTIYFSDDDLFISWFPYNQQSEKGINEIKEIVNTLDKIKIKEDNEANIQFADFLIGIPFGYTKHF